MRGFGSYPCGGLLHLFNKINMNITSFLPSIHLSDLLLYLFWGFIFFMVIRELVTWYWKINKISDTLDKIEKNTRPKETSTEIAHKPE